MVNISPEELDRLFQALSDQTRRNMLRTLSDGEQTVGALAKPHDMSLAAASKHIKVLEEAGLIRRDIRGRVHYCRIDPQPLAHARDWLRYYEQFWTQRLDALEQLLRSRTPAAAPQRRTRKPT
ncbi:transcriptional regulator [Ahniella affigens]|uniref:Transcriptional regulator n=1 Tax=Ahniella affigens TaxID=2021234 RepID=A0A2P1PND8_9GAMM|nr:metalloregulator ArsR/SmtB family transcription factor [Ahniella affigens]AVP96348.1 transcriptional regulator [Ahniella affigens]